MARSHGADVPFLRPAALAGDIPSLKPVIAHAVEQSADPHEHGHHDRQRQREDDERLGRSTQRHRSVLKLEFNGPPPFPFSIALTSA